MSDIKIKFITPSKKMDSLELNPITKIGNFQELDQTNNLKSNNMIEIEKNYGNLEKIRKSKIKSGYPKNQQLSGDEIKDLHKLIFGKDGPTLKNDRIDAIINYYETRFVPNKITNISNNVVDINTGVYIPPINYNIEDNEEDEDDTGDF
jgi:hypothetical protein